MEYITKKDLIDCSTPDEFCFSLCCINDALRLDFKSDRNVTVIYKGEEIGTFPWSVALGYCSIESENPSLTVMINDDGTLKVDYSDDDDYYTFHCVKSDSE